MTPYKSFHIDRHFNIFKDGRQVFTAYWQRCSSLKEAMNMIDTSLAFKRLPDKQAALSRLSCELERPTIADGGHGVDRNWQRE